MYDTEPILNCNGELSVDRGRCLFICGTPLQSLIAERIVELNQIRGEDCIIFFYSATDNVKYRYYYERFRQRCSDGVFYFCDFRYPSYILKAKALLRQMEFDTIYLGSVTSVFCLAALSLGKHSALFTFDDGIANILPSSIYASKHGLSVKKYLGLKVLGNKYTLNRIRRETLGHYTIYPNLGNNISKKLIPVRLFERKSRSRHESRCSVVLGTVFHEVFRAEQIPVVRAGLAKLVGALKSDVYFVPHPRDELGMVLSCQMITSEKIAEEIIEELREHYDVLDLYGFRGTTQLILLDQEGVTNTFLTVGEATGTVRRSYNLAKEAGVQTVKLLDLTTL